MMKTMHAFMSPYAREGVVRVVHRASVSCSSSPLLGSLRPGGGGYPSHQPHQRRSSSVSWNLKSIWSRVSCRSIGIATWVGANGGMLVRAMATEASRGDNRLGAGMGRRAPPRVCILGGGFGGLYTAIKLDSLLWPSEMKPQVTLVDQAERFTFKPLLYELITGTATAAEVAPLYDSVLAPYDINFVRGRVEKVLPDSLYEEDVKQGAAAEFDSSNSGGTVLLTSGEKLPYDWLVLALGAETSTFGIPGVKEHAMPFSTFEDASRVASQLDELSSLTMYPEIVVVGGGFAGVELAAAVADKLQGRGRVQLVTRSPEILQGASSGQRNAARRALEDEGVVTLLDTSVSEIRLAGASERQKPNAEENGKQNNIESSFYASNSTSSLGPKRLVLIKPRYQETVGANRPKPAPAEVLEADMVLWAAGQAPVPKIDASHLQLPFPTDPSGALRTDKTLRVLNNSKVFALGDVSILGENDENGSAKRLPATAQVAFQQADYVAWNIWSSINNRPLLNFRYQHLGDMMSLGASKGAVALPIPIPPPLSAVAQTGPLGDLLRNAGIKVSTSFAGASDGVTLEGPLAVVLRRAAYLYRQPTDQQRIRAAGSWLELAGKQAAEFAGRVFGDGSTKTRK